MMAKKERERCRMKKVVETRKGKRSEKEEGEEKENKEKNRRE